MADLREKDALSGLKHEILGVFFLASALFTAVSLYSYGQGANWGGMVGEALSRILFVTTGYTAYSLPVLLFILSVELFVRRGLRIRPSMPVSLLLFILASSGLLAGAMKESKNPGGVIGSVLSVILERYLGRTGSFIVFGTLLTVALMLATNLSFVRAGKRTVTFILGALFASVSALKKVSKDVLEALKRTKEKRASKAAGNPAPAIITPRKRKKKDQKKVTVEEDSDAAERIEFQGPGGTFRLPPTSLLEDVEHREEALDEKSLYEQSRLLAEKLRDFDIHGRVVEVRPGPVVTMYEFEPAPGIKVGRITALADDIALAMKAMSVRIIAPIPGKSVVGIEVPNLTKEAIRLKELVEGRLFTQSTSCLSLALGKDISGNPYVADLARMPHLLLAGATGTGKSVAVNGMILSILFKATPEDVRFLMIDPKMLELSAYEGIPHLITPVVTDTKRATSVLKSIVAEMSKRYRLMAEKGAKNIVRYNQIIAEKGEDPEGEHKRLPYIVVVIDELADLMMTSGKEVEECIMRLSQMARAAGIHLLVATQRPSVDVITGIIKTNFPARIAFQVPSKTDSRTILDSAGAETLLGEGDMLFMPPGTSKLQRIHGVFVSEKEIKRVTDFWKAQGSPSYDEEISEPKEEKTLFDDGELDEEFMRRYREAVEMAMKMDMISTSYIQRRFRIGYNTAARIMEKMEEDGIVGPSQGSRPREVIKRPREV